MKTAELMSEERLAHHQGAVDEKEALAGARGADLEGNENPFGSFTWFGGSSRGYFWFKR